MRHLIHISNTQVFNPSLLSLVVASGLFAAGLLTTAPAALAQYNPDPLEDLRTQDDGAGGFDDQQDIMDLMHNVMQSNGRQTMSDFMYVQQENLDEETLLFRQRQIDALNQPTAAPAETSPAESSN